MSGEGAPRFWFKVCTEAGSCFWSSETLHFAPRSVLKPFTVPSALPAPHKILFHEVGIYAPRSSASPSRLREATSSPRSWDSGERAPLLRPTPSQRPCLLGPCLHNDLSPVPVSGWVTWATHLTPWFFHARFHQLEFGSCRRRASYSAAIPVNNGGWCGVMGVMRSKDIERNRKLKKA